MKIKADLIRKPERLRPAWCQVEKVVEVDGPEFDAFLGTPQEAWPFLADSAELMHQWMGVDHCLLVLAEGRTDGVLVNSDGSDRALYAAYLPRARAIVDTELDRVADYIISRSPRQTAGESRRVPPEELEERFGVVIRAGNGLDIMLKEKLEHRPEVADVALTGNCVDTVYYPAYCRNLEEQEDIPAEFSPERAAELLDNAVSAALGLYQGEDSYAMLHDSFGLTLEEIRAHQYFSEQELTDICGVPWQVLGCCMSVRDVLHLDGVSASASLVHRDSTALIPLDDLRKLTDSGQKDFAALLDARVADIRVDEGSPKLVLEGVEAAELERFCDALEGHEQAERAMGPVM